MTICSKCNQERTVEEFYKNVQGKICKICWKARCAEYYQRNKERIRKWEKDHKDVINARDKKWRNSPKGLFFQCKEDAREKQLEFDLTLQDFEGWFANTYCTYCGIFISTTGLDRVDSTKGYLKVNIVPCCTPCNMLKKNLTKENFLTQIKKIYEHSLKKEQTYA